MSSIGIKYLTAGCLALCTAVPGTHAEVVKTTFVDHVLPIFKNSCNNCHNPDKKKAGLDLTTYQATMAGGESGSPVKPGAPDASLLYKLCTQTEEPKMPPKGDKLGDPELEVLKNWITGFALESATSKPAEPVANKVEIGTVALTRPEGPAPMPGEMPLEPFLRTTARNSLVAMAASPWAPVVAIGGQKQVLLYQTQTLDLLGVLAFPEGFPSIIRFSRNAKLLLAGGGIGAKSGRVVLWDISTGNRVAVVGDESDTVLAADLSPDHQFVATGGPGRLVKVYATANGSLVTSIKKHTDWVTALSFSPDGKYLASADRNGGIEIWEGATGKPYGTLTGHKVSVTSLAFMPGVLASSSEDGKIVLWNVKDAVEIKNWAAHPGGALWVDFTTDGRLVSCGRDKVAKVWDQTGKLLTTTEAFGELTLRATIQENRLVAGDWSGAVRVFALNEAKADPVGELTSNPPNLPDRLAAVTKELADSEAAVPPLEKSAAELGAAARAEKEAAETKRTTDLANAEKAHQENKTQLEALQKLVADSEAKAAGFRGMFTAAQSAVQEAEKNHGEKQATYNKDREMAEAQVAMEKKKLADASAEPVPSTDPNVPATVKPTEAEMALLQTAVANAEVKLAEATSRIQEVEAAKAAIVEAQKKLGEIEPQLKQADDELAAAKQITAAKTPEIQKTLETLTASVAALKKPLEPLASEQAAAKAAAELDASRNRLTKAQSSLKHWQTAQKFQEWFNARQVFQDKQLKLEEVQATAKNSAELLEKIRGEVGAREKIVLESPIIITTKEAAAVTARQENDGAKLKLGTAEKALADTTAQIQATAKLQTEAGEAAKKLGELHATLTALQAERAKTQDPSGTPESLAKEKEMAAQTAALEQTLKALAPSIQACAELAANYPNIQAAAATSREEAKTAATKLATVESEIATAKKSLETAVAELTPLKTRLPILEIDAEQTRVTLEQSSPTLTAELEAARSAMENLRQSYEVAKNPTPETKPAAGS